MKWFVAKPGGNATPSRPESSHPWHWLWISSICFFSVASGEFWKLQMRPSRSQTQSRSEFGIKVRPTELVNSKCGKATTADQFPEMPGAVSGISPFKNGPTGARELSAYGAAYELNKKPTDKTTVRN